MPADLLTCPPACPLSLTPPTSLFPDKKFPVVETHLWLDELFYYIDYSRHCFMGSLLMLSAAYCDQIAKVPLAEYLYIKIAGYCYHSVNVIR
jgi:hypothetical protein